MESESIKDFFTTRLKEGEFGDLKGTNLNLHIPVKVTFINFAVRTMLANNEKMKDFESVVFNEMENDEFELKVLHKRINKTIRGKFHPIEYNSQFEPELTIEILKGLKFYEKAAIETFFSVKKGWDWVKSKFNHNQKALEAPKEFWRLTDSKLVINFHRLMQKQGFGFLNPLIKWDGFSTNDNRFIIDIRIKI